MAHPTDFADAHARHWHDAELLNRYERWANADQLYGFSAECGMKSVLQRLGVPRDHRGLTQSKYRTHLPQLFQPFRDFAEGHASVHLLEALPPEDSFADWSTGDRYAHSSHITPAMVAQHRKAALSVREAHQLVLADRS